MIASTIPVLMPAVPEIFLMVVAFALLIGSLVKSKNVFRWSFLIAKVSLLIAAILLWMQPSVLQITFNGLFINDDFTIAIKLLLILGGIVVLILTSHSQPTEGLQVSEYPILILLAILGMMFMISAADLLSMFMGIELQSLSIYILVAMRRKNSGSSEAALKYFILGALSTGILLYGCSLIYGFTGTTNFDVLDRFFKNISKFDIHFIGPCIGLILIISALAFKISAAPFHMWAPDVYQGAPTAITAFLATVPKVAAFALLMRVLIHPFGGLSPIWYSVIAILAIISMLWGAIAALTQKNIKRFIAYSSIGHIGFALIGITLANESGLKASLIYLIFYMLMTIGLFGGLLYLEQKGKDIYSLSDLNGLGREYPFIAFLLGFILFSMAGIPPLPGLLPKLLVLRVAVNHNSYALSIFAVIYSVIAAAYYLIIIKAIFLDKPVGLELRSVTGSRKNNLPVTLVLTGIVAILIGLLIFPDAILKWAGKASTALAYS
ncbi:MAG: NADH-quinone oxidoreductase subunit N [Alphaproteobacteria bacterium]|nr:NADH-quinone oxidoreductase subunit N [Alphaproteobacteria bacterium]